MLTGELRSKIDKVWEQFWSGDLSNPITVIEQMTYLLFIRRLDDTHSQREKKVSFLNTLHELQNQVNFQWILPGKLKLV